MKIMLFLFLLAALVVGCNSGTKKMESELAAMIDSLEMKVMPVEEAANLSYFNATLSGLAADYDRASQLNLQLSMIYADKGTFDRLKLIRDSEKVMDPLLRRQLDILYNTFLSKQMDEQKLEGIIRSEMELEERFSTYRTVVDGKKLTDNEVEGVLKNSVNNAELEKVWVASKQIGDSIASSVIRLIKLRNEAARDLGFDNYHQMSLQLSEQDPEQIEQLFDELDLLTRDAFASVKNTMDSILSLRYHIRPQDLMPWHYQNRYFQEAPAIYRVNLDDYYVQKDVVQLARDYYSGIGLNVAPILEKSDLYEREGKYQHAYCTSIDRAGDVRIVCNVKNDAYWMNTMLHELGHGVYDTGIDPALPFFLRTYAHTFTTEAIANFFGRLSSNPFWIESNAGITAEEAANIQTEVEKNLQLEQLIFSRWSQVMFRFEKSMYENPDQDLNMLWWDLVSQYQFIRMPEGRDHADWASKIHIATVPCYYHNYLLGELLASQLLSYIESNVLSPSDESTASLSGNDAIGNYLKENVFAPGASYGWNEMISRATGEELTAKYYAEDFLGND